MITIKRKIQLQQRKRGPRETRIAKPVEPPVTVERGRIPRISRLMALAIRFDDLLRTGKISDVMELARLGCVTQPRISQILNLSLLAPDIQEELLFFPRITKGKASIHEKLLRPIAAQTDWERQRAMWSCVQSELLLQANCR